MKKRRMEGGVDAGEDRMNGWEKGKELVLGRRKRMRGKKGRNG